MYILRLIDIYLSNLSTYTGLFLVEFNWFEFRVFLLVDQKGIDTM